MDLAAILANLGIKPNPAMLPSQNWQGLPPAAAPVATNDMSAAQPIPQPIMLGPGAPSARPPLPFGTEQGNTLTGLPAASAPNAPLQQVALPQDSYRFPPPTDQGQPAGGMPESGMMKQAMLMIQAALDPDSIAAKADAAGIPPPDAGSLMGAEGWHNGEQTAVPGMPAPAAPAGTPPSAGSIFDAEGWMGQPAAEASVPPQLPVPVLGATPPELGPELAGSLISKPAQVTAEAAAASQPAVPPVIAQGSPPIASPLSLGYEGTATAAAPTAGAAMKENLKKALSGVQNPGGGAPKPPGSAGVISPKDFDSVAAFLAQVMSGQAAPQPAKLPFL